MMVLILITFVGKMFLTRAEMVKRDWVKPGAVVIDCGKYFFSQILAFVPVYL